MTRTPDKPPNSIQEAAGRSATGGVILGRYALAVGRPEMPTPEGWEWKRLASVAQLETGHTPSRRHPEYWDGEFPWIGIKDAGANHGGWIDDTDQHVTQAGIDNSSTRLLPANTVCLSRTASIGYIVVMRRPMCTSQDFVNWVCGPELDYRFLKYALLAEQDAILQFAHGTTHQTIYFPEVKAFHICAPEVGEQRRISDVLQALDDKIEHNRRTSRALEGLARAMFKAWFVDFEPVHAKAAGATSFPGMYSEAFAALPTRLTDSELGPVPEAWEIVDVYAIAKVIYGAPFKSQLFNEGGVGKRLIRIRDLQTHLPTVFTPEQHPKGTLVQPGDIVVGMDGEFRLHYWTGPEAWLNQRLCSFTPLPGVPAVFLGESLRAPLDYVERSEAATTVIHLGKYDIDRFQLLRPTEPVLVAFGSVTTSILNTIVHLAAESRKLAELRTYLLPKLLSGEVRVDSDDRQPNDETKGKLRTTNPQAVCHD